MTVKNDAQGQKDASNSLRLMWNRYTRVRSSGKRASAAAVMIGAENPVNKTRLPDFI
jgi:hypothetical protein